LSRITLFEKLRDKEYLERLSKRKYKELMICSLMLDEEELRSNTSITTAYRIARDRYIDKVLIDINPELANKARNKRSIPLFAKEDILNARAV